MRKSTLVLVVLAGCSFSSKLTTSGLGSSGSSGSSGGNDNVVVPDLYGLTMEQAAARLRESGIERAPEQSAQNYACDLERRPHYDRGQICYQHPVPGTTTSRRLPVTVNVQQDHDDHGNIGFSGEWRKMPDVVGKTLAAARPILIKAKLPLDEHFELLEGDCAEGTICRAEPRPSERKVLSRKGRLWVGAKAAVAPATQPTQPEDPGGFF